MITTLKIQNFECWKEAEFEFSTGVNVIVAKPGIHASDCGKSSIIRAIQWVTLNQPADDSIISNWCGNKDETIVEITFDSGNTVKRLRSKSKNLYYLNGQEFAAFGRGNVPEEIQKVINFSDLNIQTQANSFFLLKETPGEIARYLNQIVRLDKIDSSQSYADHKIRNLNNQITNTQNNYKKKRNELKNLKWVKGADAELQKAIIVENKLKGNSAHLVRLDTLLSRIKQASKEIGTIKIDPLQESVSFAFNTTKMIIAKQSKQEVLLEILRGIDYTEKKLLILLKKSKELEMEFNKTFPNICPLCGSDRK
jgi:recombinational DNA repair ATPase RecF